MFQVLTVGYFWTELHIFRYVIRIEYRVENPNFCHSAIYSTNQISSFTLTIIWICTSTYAEKPSWLIKSIGYVPESQYSVNVYIN